MAESLLELLQRSCPITLPMHMPGHKRNLDLAPYLKTLAAQLDITEIKGFDHLHAAGGILQDAMNLAAHVFGANHTFFLVNGSTVGVLSAIRSVTQPGDSIIMARNCHKSVYNALALNNLRPYFIYPQTNLRYQIAASTSLQSVEQAILQHQDARVLMLTCPTYEGVVSDLPAIISLAHRHGLTVIIDEAHGSHLGFSPYFPSGAVKAGADIVIQSLHKTMPSLTQTALAHVRTPALANEMQRQLAVFETTSPSFLLLASIDSCVRLIQKHHDELFTAWHKALEAFHEKALGLRLLRVLGYGKERGLKLENVHGLEPSKVFISTIDTNIDGYELAEILRDRFHTEPEMISPQGVLCMTGMGDTVDTMTFLGDALLEIDRGLSPAVVSKVPLMAPQVQAKVSIARAERAPFICLPIEEADGYAVAETIVVYPPGIPVVVPGEVMNRQAISYLLAAKAAHNTILRSRSDVDGEVAVLRDA
ncbi:MAG: aminotransferase class V-fold PLP-dependent enzyme [Bacillota bacterium]|nr:aminotransferase class V-fold PLP-dependent enzyme [Bacillota bacterium]